MRNDLAAPVTEAMAVIRGARRGLDRAILAYNPTDVTEDVIEWTISCLEKAYRDLTEQLETYTEMPDSHPNISRL